MPHVTKQVIRRQGRVRRVVKLNANGRPRLSVFRSSKHIYAQLVDDQKGVTLAGAADTSEGVQIDGKGKGIKYVEETIKRKVGKTGAA